MTTSPILAFQPAQGRAAGGKAGKDDGDASPGFGDMVRDAPSARDRSGKPGTDAGMRWARFAEKLELTVATTDSPAVGDRTGEVTTEDPDETTGPDGARTVFPDTFRTNTPDGFRDAGAVLAPPSFARPSAQSEIRSEAAPAHASARKPLDSQEARDDRTPGELAEDRPGPDAAGPRITIARSNAASEASPIRNILPDASSTPISSAPDGDNTLVDDAADGAAGVSESPVSRQTPPVNVLSRQDFPAPAQTTVASLTQSLAADDTFAQAMGRTRPADTPHGAIPGPAHTLRIELHPAELGTVTASLRMAGEQLTIELKVETTEAHRRLSLDSEVIVSSLRGLGYDIDKVTIVQPAAGATRQDAAASGTGGGQRGGDQLGSGAGGERPAGQQRDGGGARDGEGKAHAAATGHRAGSGVFI